MRAAAISIDWPNHRRNIKLPPISSRSQPPIARISRWLAPRTLGPKSAPGLRNATPDYATLPATNMDKLKRDVDEQRAAVDELRRQGFNNPSLVSSLGYELYVRGLLTSNMADVEDAATLIDDGLAAYGRYAHAQGWAVLNQALVYLHAGALQRRKRATTISQCNARISRRRRWHLAR